MNRTIEQEFFGTSATIKPGVGISTQGTLNFGELTPEQPKLSTTAGGLIATVEVLSGKKLDSVTRFHPSPCVLTITEPNTIGNSKFEVEVFDDAGKQDTSVSTELGSINHEYHHLYYTTDR